MTAKRALLGTTLIAGGFMLSGANAATISCPASIEGNVTNTAACEYSDTANQDFLNTDPITVNQEAFFGFTDWEYADKADINGSISYDTTHDIGFTITGDTQSGSWAIDGTAWNDWDDIMMVLKSGANTTLVGYLLAESATGGTWSSPFEDDPFGVGNTRDVSHISAYVRGDGGVTVPEPGPLALMIGGLVGLGMTRRIRSRS
ncbi:PEP-CTERM sorting domain-containing protein [Thiohalomonas denitrificans]|uniref:PEP-CTERM sorting domain-containing protein n=1 Tax=Thiohalomonas denitrificans TaxID=415747 RepID=UPI0026E96BF9|nr:PEP-CTERM sorting domain-containing protein [Thiohalomonas denitrificans]